MFTLFQINVQKSRFVLNKNYQLKITKQYIKADGKQKKNISKEVNK